MKISVYWKIITFLLMAFVSIAGIAFPVVENPSAWYQFPLIPGLEEKAKIIFFHVPTAWVAVLAFLFSTVYSIKYLRKKDIKDDRKAYAAAQLGIVFCVLATVTGAVWAKFNWGAYWSWDPRQSSIFALFLIYGAFFALRSSIESDEKRASLSAVYSIIAFVTVPFLVFIMPRIMTGLHPGSANDTSAGPVINFSMDPHMKLVFFLSLAGFTMLFYWIWQLSFRALIIKDKINQKYF